MNQWNYIDRPCASNWTQAAKLNITADCGAQLVTCLNFVSTVDKIAAEGQPQLFYNTTWTLPQQSYCVVTLDATKEVARVAFASTSFIGALIPNYLIGTQYTVESGVENITIYNGATTGQLTFILSFSGAYSALTKVVTFAAALTLLNFF